MKIDLQKRQRELEREGKFDVDMNEVHRTFDAQPIDGNFEYLPRRASEKFRRLWLLSVVSVVGPVINFFAHGAKVRGRKKSVAELADCYKNNAVFPEGSTVAISHCNCEEDALALADMVRAMGAKDVTIEYFDIVSGAHVGPGSLGIFFMGKDRRGNSAAPAKAPAGRAVRAEN